MGPAARDKLEELTNTRPPLRSRVSQLFVVFVKPKNCRFVSRFPMDKPKTRRKRPKTTSTSDFRPPYPKHLLVLQLRNVFLLLFNRSAGFFFECSNDQFRMRVKK